jgi:signal peptide peptidase SppA
MSDKARPQLSEMLLQIASCDSVVMLDVAMLSSYLLRAETAQVGAGAAGSVQPSKVAVVPVYGPLMPRSMRGWSGTIPGMDAIRASLRQAANDSDVAAIVLDIDSPGGTVAGTMETANEVKAAASQKPVIAVANSLAASAAYWIGSQATEFVMAPSADVGSIGAMIMHQDVSGMLEQWGIKMTMIRSEVSPVKNEAHPFGPLTDEARAFLQKRADDAGVEFIKAVASGRRVSQAKVKEEFGQGRVFGAREAVSRGMADRVATFDEVISGLVQKASTARSRRRSALAFE